VKLSEFILKQVGARLDACPVVVWFDGEGVFTELASSFCPPDTKVVCWDGSWLSTRRAAEDVYVQLFPLEQAGARGHRLLLYLPRKRAVTQQEQLVDPLEIFAIIGRTFGDDPADSLRSLACQAMPELTPDIDQLFTQGVPSIGTLEALGRRTEHPVLNEALGTGSLVEATALLLCKADMVDRLESTIGARAEFLNASQAEFGFKPDAGSSTAKVVDQLGRYVLVSEFVLDLAHELPASLATMAIAPRDLQARIYAICDRMRQDETLRPGYIDRAMAVERELGLESELRTLTNVGKRDTFSCEERFHLARVMAFATEGHLDEAGAVIEERRGSVWRGHEERPLLWKLADRCVRFLQAAADVEQQGLPGSAKVREWVAAYTSDDGGWRLDQLQRLFEQANADAAEYDDLESLILHCQKRYRTVAEKMQELFLQSIERDGWPPEGFLHHTSTFAHAVKPDFDADRRVAYFFVDAMRYEMGRGLADELGQYGEVSVVPVTNVLPAVTPCGMAALLPHAEVSYRLDRQGDELIPSIDGKPLPNSSSRMDYLSALLGDRFAEATLEDVLSDSKKKLNARTAGKALFVVRTQDIDGIGENMSGFNARRTMSDVISLLRVATARLAAVGYQTFVFAGDHGHLLLPEAEHGDKVAKPPGLWLKAKRRSLLGTAQGEAAGVRIMRTTHLGIPTEVPDFATPVGFGVFTSGEIYFHEGVSLEECIVPLVVLYHRASVTTQAAARVTLGYRSDRFTSYIISVKAAIDATLFQDAIEVKIEAYAGSSAKAKVVGEAADCDARSPDTKLVTLQRGVEASIPIRIQEGFSGDEIQIRATDPITGQILGQMNLRNGVQE
jgi:PglZ domain